MYKAIKNRKQRVCDSLSSVSMRRDKYQGQLTKERYFNFMRYSNFLILILMFA